MSQLIAPGNAYVSRFSAGVANTGLVGTIRFRLIDSDTAVDDPVYGPSTASIVEDPTGSGDYMFGGTVPSTAGKYFPAWDLGSGQLFYDEDIIVTQTAPAPGAPAGSDLCTLADVKAYVPAYTGDTADDVLQALITAESDLFARDARREIAQPAGGAATRNFTVNRIGEKARTVQIGDLTSPDSITVTLLKSDGTDDVTVTDLYVPLYDGARNPTAVWEPVTAISFPRHLTDAPNVCTGKVLRVNGVWGFPSIPSFVSQGVAARVIVRYLTDVAAQGTDFADAVLQSSLNFGGLNDRSEDALQAVMRKPWP